MNIKIVDKKPVEKGWSGEQKYCVTDESGTKYLLRIAPMDCYENKKVEFENMVKLAQMEISMCKPVEFGTCEEGVYVIHTWIEGVDARDVIASYSDEQIYDYGYQAGAYLRLIHSIPAPEGAEEWEVFFGRKMDRKISNYIDCLLKYENGEAFLHYIETNRHLLKNRPTTYQHGDYHIGNLMIDNDGRIVVIDFNRNEFGDPWEEFNRIVWCAQVAPMFAKGMIDGYFEKDVPKEFWDLLALYISSNALSSLPWAIPFGQEEIDVMMKLADDILDWYDGMKNTVPKWY